MRVLIAGGGTGGHLYPGIALARELQRRDPSTVVTFVGTAAGIEARVVPREGFVLDLIRVAGLKGKGMMARLRGALLLPLAAVDGWRVLSTRRPSVVVGVGGFASGPVVALAWLRINQATVGLLALLAAITGWWPILGLLALQLGVGLRFGRRFCLACVAYFELVQPRFGEGPIEDARPPRFANQVGFVVLGAATIAHAVGKGGGERVLRCVGGPSCVAKNRFGLPEELPLSWAAFVAALSNQTRTESAVCRG